MRSTIVPAQITTVEDKIIGSLNAMQVGLFALPVFGGGTLFITLPPFYEHTPFKLVLIAVCTLVSAGLAIRVRGRIVLLWLLLILRYYRRPGVYVADKNDLIRRERPASQVVTAPEQARAVTPRPHVPPRLTHIEVLHAERLLDDPRTQVSFVTNEKGVLQIHVAEVE